MNHISQNLAVGLRYMTGFLINRHFVYTHACLQLLLNMTTDKNRQTLVFLISKTLLKPEHRCSSFLTSCKDSHLDYD